jgi:hypothetical protein
LKKNLIELIMAAQACNPSYLGGGIGEIIVHGQPETCLKKQNQKQTK